MHQPESAYGENGNGVTDQSYEPCEPYEPRPHRRFRRPAVVAAAAVLILVVAPVAADRFAASRVESDTAKAFQEGMGTPLPPEVHVRGFPVLTQLASDSLGHVDITAHDIPARGTTRPLPVSELDLRLNGLTKSDDDSEAKARSAKATALLSYTDISDTLGLEFSQGSDPGQVGARIPMPFGDTVAVRATVSAASGNRIAFKDFEVTGGLLPHAGQRVLDKVFAEPIQLQNIPDGLTLRSVTTTADGLTARFSGESVTFRPDDVSSDDSTRD
ncbi:DUF2993 domain-containing protein [Streptomyces sp. NPDC059010]|uniref:LmeA family phospholipid-binding protein n=1 Tax=Streptomyces sp. NPDC059010 TaxID=3346695 RepID=UPI0036C5C103